MAKIDKKTSISKRVVSLTVFIESLFMIIITTGFLFYTFISISSNKVKLVENQTQSIVNLTEDFLHEVKNDINLLSKNPIVIDYLKYINSGNNPTIDESSSDYKLMYDYSSLVNSVIDHQENQVYDLIFLATEYNCLTATDGCAVTNEGDILYQNWFINQRPWLNALGTDEEKFVPPYLDALTDGYTFTYVRKVYDGTTEIGYIGIDISNDSLSGLIQEISEKNNHEGLDVLFITDYQENPTLAFYTDSFYDSYFMKTSSEFSSIDNELNYSENGMQELISNYELEKVKNINLFNKDYLVTYNNLQDYNWQVVVLVDNSGLISMELLFGIMMFVIGILIYLTTLLLNRRIKRVLAPINKIIQSLEEIKNGNYNVRVNLIENNEIKDIGEAINLMSEEINRQVKLVYETFAYDALTGLKNISAAKLEINRNILSGNKKAAIIMFQVENIRNINIIKGQIVGDNLLKAIAVELKKLLNNTEYLYAVNHDEFIYIMNNVSSFEMVEGTINRIFTYFKEPLAVKNLKLEVKFHMGVSTYPTDGNTLDDLVKKADTALYKAKQLGNKRYLFYNENIAREISYKAQVLEQLNKIISNNELYLKYQPLVDNRSELYGFEVLARWSSPILGEISPSSFISNAEENYMIVPIGTWILREACKNQVKLKSIYDREFVFSVNISSIQLMQLDFVDIVKSIVKETDINPEYLTLELTESVLLESTIMVDEKIADLKALGIRFSLDDFGTGYASLTYLRQIDFDNIKIDKSFIDGIFGTENDHKIVGTIVNLVHNLDMKVIAEGVETKKQYEYLKQIGTDVFQGFLMSAPLTEKEVDEFIKVFYKIAKGKRVDVLASKANF
ncbi:MAG: EAL domain-containing protein [Candidatus Izemoplasmatales bacterium]|nr:EAL domain-containing protein [Candidatus Izemoplasmatales bacterium]